MLVCENEQRNEALVGFNNERQEMQMTLEVERIKDDELKRQKEEIVEQKKAQQIEQLKDIIKRIQTLQQEGQLIKRQTEEEEEVKEKKRQNEKNKKQKLLLERQKFMDVKQSIQDQEQKQLEKEANDRAYFDIQKEREAQKLYRQMQLKQKIYDIIVIQLKEQDNNYIQGVQKQAEELQRYEEEIEQEIIQMIKEGETCCQRQLNSKKQLK